METAVFCTYCGERFSRSKHLDRHVLIHTNVKPFKCEICHVSFNRQDLYKRHIRLVHTEVEETEPTNRTPIACTNCAKAKTKCDREIPCSRCKDKKIQCQPRRSRRSAEASHREAKRRLEQERIHTESQQKLLQLARSEDSWNSPTSPSSRPSTIESSNLWAGPSSGHPDLQPAHPGYDDNASPSFSRADFSMPLTSSKIPAPPLNTPTFEAHDFIFEPQPNTLGAVTGQPYLDPTQNPDLHFDLTSFNTLLSPPTDIAHSFVDMFELDPEHLDLADAMEDVRPINPPKTSETTTPASAGQNSSAGSSRAPSIDAQAALYESWPGFACNPFPTEPPCPKTSKSYLDSLKMALRNGSSWDSNSTRDQITRECSSEEEAMCKEILSDGARDQLLVVTQTLMHKATATHTRHAPSPGSCADGAAHKADNDPFVPIPPIGTLEQFLRTYMARFEPDYRFIASHVWHPSEMLGSSLVKSSNLLLLIMVAHGAIVGSYADWCLSSTLTEACAISFREIIGTDPSRFNELEFFRMALGMVGLTIWSGDSWHMNSALRQWAMYTTWLKNTSLLSYQNLDHRFFGECTDINAAYNTWQEQEARSKLVYAWVSVDLELSVFFDTPPKLAVKNLNTAIPTDTSLENVHSVNDILASYTTLSDKFGIKRAETMIPSFNNLFQRFLERDIAGKDANLTPQQLRILLHGIQGLASHLHECLVSFFSFGFRFYGDHLTTDFGTRALLQELKSLLEHWYSMYLNSIPEDPTQDFDLCRTLIIYHLMNARVLLSFEELEFLARSDPAGNFFKKLPRVQSRLNEAAPNVIFHCGQVVKLVRAIPPNKKPAWWAAAIYRVSILLWATSWASVEARASSPNNVEARDYTNTQTFPIDRVGPDDEALTKYLRSREGTPVLTTQAGQSVPLEVPDNILAFSLEFLEEQGDNTRFVEGIKNRFIQLRERWARPHR